MTNLPELISVEVAANYTGLCQQTIKRFIRAGKLRGIKLGNKWRLRIDHFCADLAAMGVRGGTSFMRTGATAPGDQQGRQ